MNSPDGANVSNEGAPLEIESPTVEARPVQGPLERKNSAGVVIRKRDGKKARGEWLETKTGRYMPKSPGRPKNSLSAMKTLTTELLSENGVKVAEKIIKIALDDTHPQQMKALLFAGERIFPTDVFSKGIKGSQGVQIQIIGTDGTTINATSVGHPDAAGEEDEE